MDVNCKACTKRNQTCLDCAEAEIPVRLEKVRFCRTCGKPCSQDRYFNCRTCVKLETDDDVYNHVTFQSKKKKGAA